MAASSQPLFSAITFLLMASLTGSSAFVGLSTYWGQEALEGSLKDICRRGFADYVNIAFLTNFGGGQTPRLSIAHCVASTCSSLSSEIEFCQSHGVQVLISLDGAPNLVSTDDAREVASYIWNNFLGGRSDFRPLGKAVLDGVDFNIHRGNPAFLDDLARALSEYNTPKSKQVYLTASPQCPIPDPSLDATVRTGLLDYVWVKFFNHPSCQYSPGNTSALFKSWDDWASYPGVNTLFLGLPLSPDVAPNGGYITPEELVVEVTPFLHKYSNYGGVMGWPYPHHHHVTYSEIIRAYVVNKSRLQSYATAI